MGCDVHMYLEYSAFREESKPYWQMLINGAGSRDYSFFGVLAGVRSSREPLYPLRGVPVDIGREITRAYRLRVDDSLQDHAGYTAVAYAEEWGVVERNDKGVPTLCEHPDWHSASWLTHDEFAACIGEHMFSEDYALDPQYHAILAAMRALEDHGAKTRLVFWFDN